MKTLSPRELEAMQANAGVAVDVLRALSNETRLVVLCRLGRGESYLAAQTTRRGVASANGMEAVPLDLPCVGGTTIRRQSSPPDCQGKSANLRVARSARQPRLRSRYAL